MDHYYDGDDQSATTSRSSSTQFMEEEKEHLIESAGSLSQPLRRNCPGFFFRFSSPCLTLLLAISNILLLALFAGIILRPHHKASQGQNLGLLPEHTRTEIFRFETLYGEEPSKVVDDAWTALIPKGRGFVLINNETARGLPDQPQLDKSDPGDKRAIVSVFHQLHCLYMTRMGYFAAKSGNLDEVNVPHLMHCWDYLRQSIMCSADTTLEWITPDAVGSTGWGYQHTCKDFGALYAWAEEHRLTDSKRIH